MVAISDRKIEIVRTLVESAPDKIVGGLQQALAETGGDTVLARVRQMVEAEAEDRALRNTVFQPVAPLFVGDGDEARSLVFPARALALVWRGLKIAAPDQIATALKASAAVVIATAHEQRPPDPSPALDALVRATADGLRDRDLREFRLAVELCDAARPGGAEALAACLDISHVVRRTLPRLDDWISHSGGDTGAAARLAYKDAVAIAEDAGPRFFEMLACQLSPPWMILRIISSVMDKPTERYLSESELGGFPERVMDQVDAALKAIGKLDLNGGPAAGRAAGRLVELITQQTFELEVAMELTRDNGWGKRIVGQKRALANLAEARLRETAKLVAAALPMASFQLGRTRKRRPKLDEMPAPQSFGRALTLLNFAHEVRHCASYSGFSAVHTKVTDGLGDSVDHYVDDVLDHLRTGDVANVAIAHAFLMFAADVTGLVRDDKAADLVRRRAAGACAYTPPDNTVTIDA